MASGVTVKLTNETEYPDDLFDPPPPPRAARGVRRASAPPRSDIIEKVKMTLDLISGGMPAKEAYSITGVSDTTYRDVKNWLKKR